MLHVAKLGSLGFEGSEFSCVTDLSNFKHRREKYVAPLPRDVRLVCQWVKVWSICEWLRLKNRLTHGRRWKFVLKERVRMTNNGWETISAWVFIKRKNNDVNMTTWNRKNTSQNSAQKERPTCNTKFGKKTHFWVWKKKEQQVAAAAVRRRWLISTKIHQNPAGPARAIP